MVGGLLLSSVLSGMEACINQVLSLDAGARRKLEPLAGKSLRIRSESPPFAFTITVGDNRLALAQEAGMEVDATVSGAAAALVKLLVSGDTSSLHAEGITVTGSTSLLADLQKILGNLDLDWEYQVSRLIGDIPTQFISDSLAAASRFAERTGRNLQQDIDDYLHEEKKLFPAAPELESFYRRIDDLRLRVDRLDSRISRLVSSQDKQ